MHFENRTAFPAAWTMGFDKAAHEMVVVVAKATFRIPDWGNSETPLVEDQVDLVAADRVAGALGFSSTVYESDFAHHKPFCDVLLNGTAHAPKGRPCRAVTVRMKVGSLDKSIHVVGDRYWADPWLEVTTDPEPFLNLPVTYENAYGGFERDPNNPERGSTYLPNPVGTGYYPVSRHGGLAGKRLPNLERPGESIHTAVGDYVPQAFSCVGRNFPSRLRYAGTYDQRWQDEDAPFFPKDFDYRYFQAAPPDQQIPYLAGGEEVWLENLDPRGVIYFAIPRTMLKVLFVFHSGKQRSFDPVADTLMIEPDLRRFTISWRTSISLSQDCFEIERVIVAEPDRAWLTVRPPASKPHYGSIQEYIESKRRS